MGRITAAEAKEIYQGLLDKVIESYRQRDFGAFAAVVHVPHHITTPHETITIRNAEQLRAVFDSVCALIHAVENVAVTGVCHGAKSRGRDRIDGEYTTEFPDGHPILPATIHSKTVVMWIGGNWAACVSHYAFGKDDVVANALREAVKI